MKVLVVVPNFLPLDQIRSAVSTITQDVEVRTDTDFDRSDAEILIVTTFTPVNGDLLKKMPRLRFVQVASIGYDNVDMNAMKKNGIMVSNIPTASADSVAEHALSMVLSLIKDQRFLDAEIRSGRWPRITRSSDLMGKTFGIVGMGSIGRALAARLLPFKVAIIYNDTKRMSEAEEEEYGATFVSLDRLLSDSDVISVHVPLNETTRHMFNSSRFGLMKDGAIFINTSRGEVVVEKDLIEAIQKKGIRAGLDVFEHEPPDPNSPLFRLENTLFSPHIAGVTAESQMRFFRETIANVMRYMQGYDPNFRVI
ncbi:2-hydroxyacid dehydrogenase related protein [Thermoplasma acidophilum]|uniref:2-hydroxyacid dehydrogenase related protein n=1 Tax=Thermoplasma acidophilum (strain ATCC 25905 / DSM 1728 / JCM 9062 / NBRC 15155 / AMRC-C165) TaxID=273075 RepID=Q9HK29_THEAC|nr:2-hydroxyacid dehydrogenase [Thermoplasma acidophilum]CAC11910.1 2-hydroxyacid dehydrogenase related protein [Thermoplasma acidophilum]